MEFSPMKILMNVVIARNSIALVIAFLLMIDAEFLKIIDVDFFVMIGFAFLSLMGSMEFSLDMNAMRLMFLV